MYKWGLAPSLNCECGAPEQTADHVRIACSMHRAPDGALGLAVLDENIGLTPSLPASYSGSTAVWSSGGDSLRLNPVYN